MSDSEVSITFVPPDIEGIARNILEWHKIKIKAKDWKRK